MKKSGKMEATSDAYFYKVVTSERIAKSDSIKLIKLYAAPLFIFFVLFCLDGFKSWTVAVICIFQIFLTSEHTLPSDPFQTIWYSS